MTKTLRELALAATPGPWHSPGMGEVHMPSHDSVAQICFRHEFADDDEMFGTQDDAAYIVAACNAVPALLDTIDEQQRTIAALMVGAPDDTTTPVIRRIAELENTIDEQQREIAGLREALKEVLAAERFSNRPPTTVREAEAKMDRIRKAVVMAESALTPTNEGEKE